MALVNCGTIISHAGKTIAVKVRDDSYAPQLYVAAEGIRDGSRQSVRSIDDMRAPGFSHTPVAKQVLARGATHVVVLGYGKDAILIAIGEATAAHLKGILDDAGRRGVAAQEKQAEAGWDAAERACPEGHMPAAVEWTNGDLCARGVVTRDGIKTTVPDTAELHGEYAWVPAADIEAKRGAARAKAEAAAANEAALGAVAVPTEALKAYARYRGSDDAAWKAEDESAWSLIRRYGAAIRVQGLSNMPAAAALPPISPEDVADHAGG